MKVDELRRGLDDAGRRDIDVVEARAAVGARTARRRRRNHQLVGVVTVAVIAAIAVPIAVLRDDSKPTVRVGPQPVENVGSWARVSKTGAGLPAGASFAALAATDRSLLLGGAELGDRQSSIWYSDDGVTWNRSLLPASPGAATDVFVRPSRVRAIATSGHTALAIGSDQSGNVPFVWQSDDDGRTWRIVAAGEGLFGPPAPEMGRPFVDGLTYADGKWIASGGGSSGYGAIWTSADGTQWTQVLDTKPGPPNTGVGGVNVIDADTGDRNLLAYGGNVAWRSSDGGSTWGQPVIENVPAPFYLRSITFGMIAFGENKLKHGRPTPLLMPGGSGPSRSWFVVHPFLEHFPGARVQNVARRGALWVATGTSGSPAHPDAWICTSPAYWRALPAALYGATDTGGTTESGTLSLSASLGDRIVLFGTSAGLDRYYTYDIPTDESR
jgi:hypothetical protein